MIELLFWDGQRCPLFDAVYLTFPLPTTASPTFQGALEDSFGEAVVESDVPEPCKFQSQDGSFAIDKALNIKNETVNSNTSGGLLAYTLRRAELGVQKSQAADGWTVVNRLECWFITLLLPTRKMMGLRQNRASSRRLTSKYVGTATHKPVRPVEERAVLVVGRASEQGHDWLKLEQTQGHDWLKLEQKHGHHWLKLKQKQGHHWLKSEQKQRHTWLKLEQKQGHDLLKLEQTQGYYGLKLEHAKGHDWLTRNRNKDITG